MLKKLKKLLLKLDPYHKKYLDLKAEHEKLISDIKQYLEDKRKIDEEK
jgi:hypothetical protein